ncbi:hypothetical protein EDC04DRAFT_2604479 [Pisolithus marmoratus]|nr:hypothetical protein EDC04DRAFT_2604479 [Pisolithus marmoratus]
MPLTLEEMLNLVEEEEIGESGYRFAGGDAEIVAKVNHKMAVKRGEAVEVDDEVEEAVDEENEPEIKLSEAIHLCKQMECISITYGTCIYGSSRLSCSRGKQQGCCSQHWIGIAIQQPNFGTHKPVSFYQQEFNQCHCWSMESGLWMHEKLGCSWQGPSGILALAACVRVGPSPRLKGMAKGWDYLISKVEWGGAKGADRSPTSGVEGQKRASGSAHVLLPCTSSALIFQRLEKYWDLERELGGGHSEAGAVQYQKVGISIWRY